MPLDFVYKEVLALAAVSSHSFLNCDETIGYGYKSLLVFSHLVSM
jgi:hypothetical protein